MRDHPCAAVLALLLATQLAGGMELWSQQQKERHLTLSPTLKTSALLAHHPDDAFLFPHEWSALSLSRLRLDLHARWGDDLDARLAYEFGARWYNQHDGITDLLGLSSLTLPIPFRLTPVHHDWYEGKRLLGTRELDRAFVAFPPDWGEVVVGRQAIGLGRGVLFSATDLFSPFSPVEVDREWRRGGDAVRLERRLSPTASIELIAVGGEHWDESAFLCRLRGYFGLVDAAVLGGRRGTDQFVGAVVSAATGDAEAHGEVMVFRTRDEHPQGSIFGDGDTIPKAVLGGSYTFNVGNGLTVLGEYHYSGFASHEADQAQLLFVQPEYLARYLRGDTQIICRHAVGLQLAYSLNEALTSTVNVILNPRDGSGVLSPSMRWDISRNVSLTVAGYLGWGEQPVNAMLQSEYGAYGQSLFAQLGLYF